MQKSLKHFPITTTSAKPTEGLPLSNLKSQIPPVSVLCALCVLCGSIGITRSHACAPPFTTSAIDDGNAALLKAPVADFEVEIDRLSPSPDPKLRALPVEPPSYDNQDAHGTQTMDAEAADLLAATNKPALAEELRAWRRILHPDPSKTAPPPANLPAEFALYETGALRYLGKDVPAARTAWLQLLDLPESQRHWRSTWAAYMLGRSYVDADPAKASQYFQLTRTLVKNGFSDTTGLAAASFGWEARAFWKANQPIPALHLYLQQYAIKDENTAIWSLRDCAVQLLSADDARLKEVATDPVARNIVTACLLADYGPYHRESLDRIEKQRRWLTLLAATFTDDIPGADRLAWAAYQSGDIPETQRWLKVGGKKASQSPIGEWIQAKLALRAGKLDAAANHLARAAHAFPPDEEWPERTAEGDPVFRPAAHAAGELAALKLSRGQFVESLDLLFRNDFVADATYVAERVLTPDELKRYIDKNWPTSFDLPETHTDPWTPAQQHEFSINNLRELLACRLTRLGRWKEARPYFLPQNQKLLDTYIAAIRAGHDPKRPPIDRAHSLIEAAHIARNHGWELLGTYIQPEDVSEPGKYFEAPSQRDNASPEERKRFATSAPDPDRRWQFRYVAADLAWDAAQLLPDNNDELAETLIDAGNWIKAQDPKAANRFYKALVTRCSNTDLGREADRLHWFPPLRQNSPPTTQP